MNVLTMQRIITDFSQLALPDQLLLIERLVQQIRQHTVALPARPSLESQLVAMASDPDIQRELRQIEVEFAGTD